MHNKVNRDSVAARRSAWLFAICAIMTFFCPTSINGVQIETEWAIANALVMGIVLFALFWNNGVSKKGLVLAIALALLLVISTMLVIQGHDGAFSIARFAPMILALFLLSLRLTSFRMQQKHAVRFVDFIVCIIVLWNIICMLHVPWFEGFVINFYTQLDDYTATQYALLIGRPVFTFGVHNFASVFYLVLFYLSIRIYFKIRRFRFLVYGVVLLVFTLLLRSTAAYGTAAVMLLICAWYLWKHNRSAAKYLLVFIAVVGVIAIFTNPAVIQRLLLDSNGFIPRYFSNDLYQGNIDFLNNYPLGLGYTIPQDESIYLADSGFWIYRTMGNIPLVAGLGVLAVFFILNNFKGDDRLFMGMSILLAELSFASLLYWKTLFLLLILVVLLNSLSEDNPNNISNNVLPR